MVLLPYSSDEQARFAELAEIYGASREAYRDLMTETSAKPAPGSRCATELAELAAGESPVAEDSEGLIVWAVQLYLYAASEHIGSLSALYGANEVLIAPLVVARAAIENSAHVIWILGSADEGARDRLARAFLEAIFGADEAKKQSGRLRGKSDDDHKERTAHYRWLKKRAAESFEEPHQDDDGRPLLHGHQMPAPESLIRGPARHGPWKTVEEVELATLGWVHWHNTTRLHGYLNDLSPAEFENNHYAAQQDDQVLA